MSGTNKVGSTKSRKIMRFPRLPEGKDVAGLAKGVWTVPTFTVNEVEGVTNFVFSVRLRDKIRSHDRHLYRSLFESGGPVWTAALEAAYLSARSGKKTVAKYMDTLLYMVFRGAVEILMKDAKTDTRNYDEPYATAFNTTVDNAAKDFVSMAGRKKGRKRTRQADETRPIRLAERHATLTLLVSELRQFIKELKAKGVLKEEVLREEVRRAFKDHDWINYVVDGCAFQELPPNAGDTALTQSSLGGKWAPWQLTIGIIRCEERKHHHGRPIGVVTIFRLVARGKKVLKNSETARK